MKWTNHNSTVTEVETKNDVTDKYKIKENSAKSLPNNIGEERFLSVTINEGKRFSQDM